MLKRWLDWYQGLDRDYQDLAFALASLILAVLMAVGLAACQAFA